MKVVSRKFIRVRSIASLTGSGDQWIRQISIERELNDAVQNRDSISSSASERKTQFDVSFQRKVGNNRRLYLEFFLRTQRPISQPGSPTTSAYAGAGGCGGGVLPAVVLPLFPFAFLSSSLSLASRPSVHVLKRRSLNALAPTKRNSKLPFAGLSPFYWTI